MALKTAQQPGDVFGADPESVRAEVLTTPHPLYAKHYPFWTKVIDLAEGDNLGQYIHRHARESIDSHKFRRDRVSHRNFTGPILDLKMAYLFSKAITREATKQTKGRPTRDRPIVPMTGGRVIDLATVRGTRGRNPNEFDDEWKQFLYNVDQQGNSIDRFMRRISYWALGLGMMHVLVDMPRVSNRPRSRRDEKQQKISPYFSEYFPLDTVNWETDELGRYNWIRFREPITGERQPFDPKSVDALQMLADAPRPRGTSTGRRDDIPRPRRALYRTLTRAGWFLHEVSDDRVTLKDQDTYDLGVVPVVTVYNRPRARTPIIGLSDVQDIVGINQDILNLDSLIVEAIYQQVLNILVMKRQPTPGQKEIIIGPENVLEYFGDNPPFFITPSTAPLQYMEARIQGLQGEIYRLAKFSGGNALDVRPVPSGLAQTVEFNETDRALAEKAEELQNAEWQMHYLWFLWKGSIFDGTIDYPDTFQVQSFLEELQQITQAKQAIRSDRFTREMEKRCVRRMLPNVPQDVLDDIEREIDIIPPSISSFSGPVWYDPITQEVKAPTDTRPIGVLGEVLAKLEAETGQSMLPPSPAELAAQQTGMNPDGTPMNTSSGNAQGA